MRIGLFVPCYVDAFEPEVGIATLELLERLGLDVAYPFDQTCCGQPMTNTGCHAEAAATEALLALDRVASGRSDSSGNPTDLQSIEPGTLRAWAIVHGFAHLVADGQLSPEAASRALAADGTGV